MSNSLIVFIFSCSLVVLLTGRIQQSDSEPQVPAVAKFPCRFGERLCGRSCYNLSRESCQPGLIICPLREKACGSRCYDDVRKTCFPGNVLCDKSQLPCGFRCYNFKYEMCRKGNIIDSIGHRGGNVIINQNPGR